MVTNFRFLGGLRYLLRLACAALAYGALPAIAGLLAWRGHPWWSTSVLGLSAALECTLLVVFRGLPFPASPRTLRQLDFAGIAWLPHAAVTRLPEEQLHGRVAARRLGRISLAFAVLLGTKLGVLAVLAARVSSWHPTLWLVLLVCAFGALMALGVWGREKRQGARRRGPLPPGTDIG